MMKNTFNKLLVVLLLWLAGGTGHASLLSSATLNFDNPVYDSDGLVIAGSNFGVDLNNDAIIDLSERTGLTSNDGLILGVTQPGSVAAPGIDAPWVFFGVQGIHLTTSPVTILTDDGFGNVELDFSGWAVDWNGNHIGLGGAAWGSNSDGVAVMTCASDCSVGDSFTLFYTATVTDGPFTGVRYRLGFDSGAVSPAAALGVTLAAAVEDPGVVMTGTVVPVPAAVWLFGSGMLGLIGVARRRKAV